MLWVYKQSKYAGPEIIHRRGNQYNAVRIMMLESHTAQLLQNFPPGNDHCDRITDYAFLIFDLTLLRQLMTYLIKHFRFPYF